MWKSGICLRNQRFFYQQSLCGKSLGYQQEKFLWKKEKFVHRNFFHIPQTLWINYRQELMLAVMSRMWFCRLLSPSAKALSTFLMEYKMVE